MNDDLTDVQKEREMQARREVDSHVVADFDYGPDGVPRVSQANLDIVYKEEKPNPVLEQLDGQLDYSESEIQDCRNSTAKPVTDFDAWQEKVEALAEVQDFKQLRQEFNLAIVKTLNSGPADIIQIRDTMAKIKPNDPKSRRQISHMIKVIRQKLEEGQ